MNNFTRGKPYHGSDEVTGGKLKGMTDTDYFYFLCPKCTDTQILRVLDYCVRSEGEPRGLDGEGPLAKRGFILAFELHCPQCGLHDFVKVSNMGWQGGKLKNSIALLAD